jgi:hypothetical protein
LFLTVFVNPDREARVVVVVVDAAELSENVEDTDDVIGTLVHVSSSRGNPLLGVIASNS